VRPSWSGSFSINFFKIVAKGTHIRLVKDPPTPLSGCWEITCFYLLGFVCFSPSSKNNLSIFDIAISISLFVYKLSCNVHYFYKATNYTWQQGNHSPFLSYFS
jgi:hypothetical protein